MVNHSPDRAAWLQDPKRLSISAFGIRRTKEHAPGVHNIKAIILKWQVLGVCRAQRISFGRNAVQSQSLRCQTNSSFRQIDASRMVSILTPVLKVRTRADTDLEDVLADCAFEVREGRNV